MTWHTRFAKRDQWEYCEKAMTNCCLRKNFSAAIFFFLLSDHLYKAVMKSLAILLVGCVLYEER
jgi:hypothetical protein